MQERSQGTCSPLWCCLSLMLPCNQDLKMWITCTRCSTIPISEAGKWCKHLEICFAPEEGVRSVWPFRSHSASSGTSLGLCISATLGSHCLQLMPLQRLCCHGLVPCCRFLGAHRTQWQSQHVCWEQHSQPAAVALFILPWQGKNSSRLLSWNGCAVAESRMGSAVLYIKLSLPGNAKRWLPAVWTPAAGWNAVLPTPTHSPRYVKTTFCQWKYSWVFPLGITPVTPDTKGTDGFF